jgi:hypothetical protein
MGDQYQYLVVWASEYDYAIYHQQGYAVKGWDCAVRQARAQIQNFALPQDHIIICSRKGEVYVRYIWHDGEVWEMVPRKEPARLGQLESAPAHPQLHG